MLDTTTKEYDLYGNQEHIDQFLQGLSAELLHGPPDIPEAILEWARLVSVQYGLVQGVMTGGVEITGWVGSGAPQFSITKAGSDYVENELLNPFPEMIDEREGGEG